MKYLRSLVSKISIPAILKAYKFYATIGIILFYSIQLSAQKICTGIIIDTDSKEPVSFATVWAKHSLQESCLSQLDGSFTIQIPKGDTLMITSIGYADVSIPYALIPSTITIELIPAAIQLETAVITPGKNPAIPIVKTAIRNRRDNRPDMIETIDFIQYNKINLRLSDLDTSIQNSKFITKHPDILIKARDYDTSYSVPFYFSERLTYEQRKPNSSPIVQEIVQNQHGANFINSDLAEKYIASLNENLTFYGNLRFLSKDLISPISPQAILYYRYYLRDSLIHDSIMYYRISFKPKNLQDMAFNGYMIIEKHTGVLTEIQATLQHGANLNFVKSLTLQEKLEKQPNGNWFYKQQKFEVKFTPELLKDTAINKFAPPIAAIKTTGYITDSVLIQNYIQHRQIPTKFNLTYRHVKQDTSLLSKLRTDTLSSLDITTKGAIEASNDIALMRLSNNILSMLLYGYYPLGYIDVGPYLYFVQSNEIEGIRYNISAQTSEKLIKGMRLGGYIGYGSRDKLFKYGAHYSLHLPTKLYGALHASYDQNIYRIGDYKQNLGYIRENAWVQSDDNFLSALSSKNPNYAVYFVKKAMIAQEQQITPNIILKPQYMYSKHYNAPFYNFDTIDNSIDYFQVHEASLNIRFSYKEEISNSHFRRMYIDTRYPVVHLNVNEGMFFYNNQSGTYTKFRLVAKHNILVGVGKLKYVVETGYTMGDVPFPLIEYMRGNETGASGEYYFNLMKYMEFSADRFVNVFAEYGLQGFIFNKIPLIKKLYLREIMTCKLSWGDMTQTHSNIFPVPKFTKTPTKPYIEAGLGVSNIFRLFRVEYVWRLNYLDEPDVLKHGLFFSFRFEF